LPTSKIAGVGGKLVIELSMPNEATVTYQTAYAEERPTEEGYRYVYENVWVLHLDGECIIKKEGALPAMPLKLEVVVDTDPKLRIYEIPEPELDRPIPISITYTWDQKPQPFTLTTIVKAALRGPIVVAKGEAQAQTKVNVV
jgi:hypothetical protein